VLKHPNVSVHQCKNSPKVIVVIIRKIEVVSGKVSPQAVTPHSRKVMVSIVSLVCLSCCSLYTSVAPASWID